MAEIFTAAFWAEYGGILAEGVWDTLLMTGLSTLLAYLIGLPMGVVMILTQPHGIRPNRAVNAVLGWVINIGRSLPFIILMIALFPFTKLVVGTKIGIKGAVVPLVVSAAPFIARMVETALSEVDAGVIEAAQSMGASTFQIVWKVYLPEAKPSLILGGSVVLIAIVGYTAMAGIMGAPAERPLGDVGYGDFPHHFGPSRSIRFQPPVGAHRQAFEIRAFPLSPPTPSRAQRGRRPEGGKPPIPKIIRNKSLFLNWRNTV